RKSIGPWLRGKISTPLPHTADFAVIGDGPAFTDCAIPGIGRTRFLLRDLSGVDHAFRYGAI
ncbi:MAG: hypothetical protein AAFY74_20690, partial [Pseudomonadota bacterium]